MTEAIFYQFLVANFESSFPKFLENFQKENTYSIVRTSDDNRLEYLDRLLWSYIPESFLPHSTSHDKEVQNTPLYLTTGKENPNKSSNLILVDGATVLTSEISTFERLCVFFDCNEVSHVCDARKLWKYACSEEIDRKFWKQTAEGWNQVAGSS